MSFCKDPVLQQAEILVVTEAELQVKHVSQTWFLIEQAKDVSIFLNWKNLQGFSFFCNSVENCNLFSIYHFS